MFDTCSEPSFLYRTHSLYTDVAFFFFLKIEENESGESAARKNKGGERERHQSPAQVERQRQDLR